MKISKLEPGPNAELNKQRDVTIKVRDDGNAPFAAEYLKSLILTWIKNQTGIKIEAHTEYSITINTNEWEIR